MGLLAGNDLAVVARARREVVVGYARVYRRLWSPATEASTGVARGAQHVRLTPLQANVIALDRDVAPILSKRCQLGLGRGYAGLVSSVALLCLGRLTPLIGPLEPIATLELRCFIFNNLWLK